MKIIVRLVEAENGYFIEVGRIEREGDLMDFKIARIAHSATSCGKHIAALLTEMRLKEKEKQ